MCGTSVVAGRVVWPIGFSSRKTKQFFLIFQKYTLEKYKKNIYKDTLIHSLTHSRTTERTERLRCDAFVTNDGDDDTNGRETTRYDLLQRTTKQSLKAPQKEVVHRIQNS